MKEDLLWGLNGAKQGVVAGASVAFEKGSEVLNHAGAATKEGLDWTAESMKYGANVMLEVGKDSVSAVKQKMSEVSITDTAAMAAEKAKIAGGFVLASGASGLSYMNSKIDEHEKLAYAKQQAAEGARLAA